MDAKVTNGDILAEKLRSRSAKIGIIGLGYVGLPLATAVTTAGFRTTGFDVNRSKIGHLRAGESYVEAVDSQMLADFVQSGTFSPTCKFLDLEACDVIVICVPTPITEQRSPDLNQVISAAESIAGFRRRSQLVVLSSTTWPGTTDEVVIPILQSGGLISGIDFWVGYSPEREDPGNQDFGTTTIPRIVSGDGEVARSLTARFYSAFVETVVPVSTPRTAEAVKITENVYRAVNIALVNETKIIYDAMGIDIWEVIEAASTKPFGFTPFYPGPGLGGHCIPVDPHYLAWKARELSTSTRFVDLAGEINISMPGYVVAKLGEALDLHLRKSIGSSKILVLGLAYKRNISDIRGSPAQEIIETLEKRGAEVLLHDPHLAEFSITDRCSECSRRKSIVLDATTIRHMDAVLVVTDHDEVDYELVAKNAGMVIDTRNVMRRLKLDCRVLVQA